MLSISTSNSQDLYPTNNDSMDSLYINNQASKSSELYPNDELSDLPEIELDKSKNEKEELSLDEKIQEINKAKKALSKKMQKISGLEIDFFKDENLETLGQKLYKLKGIQIHCNKILDLFSFKKSTETVDLFDEKAVWKVINSIQFIGSIIKFDDSGIKVYCDDLYWLELTKTKISINGRAYSAEANVSISDLNPYVQQCLNVIDAEIENDRIANLIAPKQKEDTKTQNGCQDLQRIVVVALLAGLIFLNMR